MIAAAQWAAAAAALVAAVALSPRLWAADANHVNDCPRAEGR